MRVGYDRALCAEAGCGRTPRIERPWATLLHPPRRSEAMFVSEASQWTPLVTAACKGPEIPLRRLQSQFCLMSATSLLVYR